MQGCGFHSATPTLRQSTPTWCRELPPTALMTALYARLSGCSPAALSSSNSRSADLHTHKHTHTHTTDIVTLKTAAHQKKVNLWPPFTGHFLSPGYDSQLFTSLYVVSPSLHTLPLRPARTSTRPPARTR
jgi:hypothetical protein